MPASTPTAKTAASPAKTAEATTADDPVTSEKLAWDALKRKDYDAFASFLDDAQIEVEADGVYDKAGTLKGVRMFDASKFELSDFKIVSFDSDASLVTYVVKPSTPKASLERHSTIWVKRNGKWRALFHQGTPARPGSGADKGSPRLRPKRHLLPRRKLRLRNLSLEACSRKKGRGSNPLPLFCLRRVSSKIRTLAPEVRDVKA